MSKQECGLSGATLERGEEQIPSSEIIDVVRPISMIELQYQLLRLPQHDLRLANLIRILNMLHSGDDGVLYLRQDFVRMILINESFEDFKAQTRRRKLRGLGPILHACLRSVVMAVLNQEQKAEVLAWPSISRTQLEFVLAILQGSQSVERVIEKITKAGLFHNLSGETVLDSRYIQFIVQFEKIDDFHEVVNNVFVHFERKHLGAITYQELRTAVLTILGELNAELL